MATSDSTPFKRCTKCGIEKLATQEFFSPNKKGLFGLRANCKDCAKIYSTQRRRAKGAKPRISTSNSNDMKRCAKCKKLLPATPKHFNRNRTRKDGFANRCRDCANLARRERRQANIEVARRKDRERYTRDRDRIQSRSKKYYPRMNERRRKERLSNPEDVRRKDRERYVRHKTRILTNRRENDHRNPERKKRQNRNAYLKNPDAYKNQSKQWREDNPDRFKELQRKSRIKRRDKNRQWQRDYYKSHPDLRRIKLQRQLTRKRNLPIDFSITDWQRALEYFNHCCAVCGRPKGLFHTLAMDHWIPLSSPDCPGTVAANIIPLCHGIDGCNNSKSNKPPADWLEQRFGQRKANSILKHIQAYFASLKTNEGE